MILNRTGYLFAECLPHGFSIPLFCVFGFNLLHIPCHVKLSEAQKEEFVDRFVRPLAPNGNLREMTEFPPEITQKVEVSGKLRFVFDKEAGNQLGGQYWYWQFEVEQLIYGPYANKWQQFQLTIEGILLGLVKMAIVLTPVLCLLEGLVWVIAWLMQVLRIV